MFVNSNSEVVYLQSIVLQMLPTTFVLTAFPILHQFG